MADDDEPLDPPHQDDLRHDDLEFNPQALPPKDAKAWLNLLKESEDAFKDWHDHVDKIDLQLASLMRLGNLGREREMQILWANLEVIKPTIYARPPIPVVVTKFKDRRPVYQAASEIAERCTVVAFDLTNIDELMKLIRDDLAITNRGVAWCRYESASEGYYATERVCIDFKCRRDFLHSLSRNWREVTWVAGASYLTRGEARKRFHAYSGDEYQDADYKIDKDSQEVGGGDARERGKFWEIWDKTTQRVVWVAEGCEHILDEDDPHLELRNYFPCPKPAYGTVQRDSLVPVPDPLQYADQLQEVNMLTGRIHALADAIEAKGFYPAGGNELADAVQAAVETHTPGRVLVPVSNWAAFGGTKDVIIWLPIDQIATTIQGLVMLRKQIIDDIYQITGLADIMRGDTDPQETLGAQELKTQYGSTRIRDKQQELVRIAKDLVEITLEIITSKFKGDTIVEMSQTQLPTQAMVMQKAQEIQSTLQTLQQQAQQAQLNPRAQQMTQQQPEMAQQVMGQAQQQMQASMQALEKLRHQPTIEQVLHFFKDNRATQFVLDIETDSTIQPDEDAEKQRRNEFVGELSTLLPQLAQMITAEPKTSEFCGEVLKFATAPYRVGRSLDGAIDDLVEQMKQKGEQPQGDDPTTAANKVAMQIEQMKLNAQQQTDAGKLQLEQQKLAMQDRHKQAELANQRYIEQLKMGQSQGPEGPGPDDMIKLQVQREKLQQSRETHQANMLEKSQDMQLAQQKAVLAAQAHQQRASDMAARRQQQAAQAALRPTPIGGGNARR